MSLHKVFINGKPWKKGQIVDCDTVHQAKDYLREHGFAGDDDEVTIEPHNPTIEAKIIPLEFKGFKFTDQTPMSEAFLRTFANLVATYGQDEFIKHARFHLKELKPKKVG